MKRPGLIVGTALLVLCMSAQASAATRYAAPSGVGPADKCHKGNPCSLIDAVEDPSVADGDNVIVTPGNYDLGSHELDIGHKIDLHGRRGHPAHIDAASDPSGEAINLGGNARMSDLVIDDTTAQAFSPFFSDSAHVERVVAIGSSDTFAACGAPRRPGWIRDSVCVNTGGGPALGVFESGAGTVDFDIANVTAISTVTGSSGKDNGLRFETPSSESARVHATNVIASGATNADLFAASSSPDTTSIKAKHCDFASRGVADTGTVSAPGSGSNITAAPKFVDAGVFDFRQRRKSPTVDAGAGDAPVVGIGKLDFEGQNRRHGAKVDIGADEFH